METPIRQQHKSKTLEDVWHQILRQIARQVMQVWITQQHVEASQSFQAEQSYTTLPLNHSRLISGSETTKASNHRRTT